MNKQNRCQYERGQKLYHCLSFQREDKYSATEKTVFPFSFLWLNSLPRETLLTEEAENLDIGVLEREKQIASPQPLLQLTLKNICFKSMILKWRTWPNHLPFPFLYGHLAGRDFSELVNTQKLWPDNQFLNKKPGSSGEKIAHFPFWLVVRPRKWSQQQELKFDIPEIGREGRWEVMQWWRKLKFYLEFTKLFLFLENHHNTVTVLWNAECKRGFMKLLRGRGKPCLQKVTTIMHCCVKREVIYNPMYRTKSWGEASG